MPRRRWIELDAPPEADVRRLADALAEPAEVVAVADDWRAGLVPLA